MCEEAGMFKHILVGIEIGSNFLNTIFNKMFIVYIKCER